MAKTTNGRKKPESKEPVVNELEQFLIRNAFLARSGFLQEYLTATRDIDGECGYPGQSLATVSTTELTADLFKYFYEREPIANRVVHVFPEESWNILPEVFETDTEDEETEFEQKWNELSLKLTEESKFKRKKGSPIWEYLRRADILSGIGSFGILFLSFDDGKDLREPVEPSDNLKLQFMRAFDQSCVDITQFESDLSNARFGLPTMYSVEFSNPTTRSGGVGAANLTKNVHWSRVIHIADNIGSNEVYGIPRMHPVFNRLWDLRKMYGGSAEMYWKGAFPGISVETHPQLGASASFDVTALREMIEDYQNGLQRYLALNGMTANSLTPQVSDPTDSIDTQIDAICIQLGIPKRIFIGSERGELASSQDDKTWNRRLNTRQNMYITPRIIVPFIDRLILLGVLPEPEEYQVNWPNLESLTEQEKAMVSVKQVEAMTKYVAGDVSMIMHPIDLYTKIMGFSSDEAQAIIDAAAENIEEEEEEDTEVFDEIDVEEDVDLEEEMVEIEVE